MSAKKFDYDSVPGDYQYKAIQSGHGLQKFWHSYKIKLINQIVPFKSSDIVLDLGCGSGNVLISISKRVNKAYGADISQSALNFIKNRKEKENLMNVEVVKLNENKPWPFEKNSFDKIILTEVIEHLNNPKIFVENCKKILKPGGLILITTPNYFSFWPILEFVSDLFHLTPKMKGEQHISKFNKKSMKKLMNSLGFNVKKLKTFYFISPFIYIISKNLAKRSFYNEIQSNILPGMLLYTLAQKID